MDRNAVIEECAAVMDREAARWAESKKNKLEPLTTDCPQSLFETHDRYFNYIENAKRCATDIRKLKTAVAT